MHPQLETAALQAPPYQQPSTLRAGQLLLQLLLLPLLLVARCQLRPVLLLLRQHLQQQQTGLTRMLFLPQLQGQPLVAVSWPLDLHDM
jgi:hypothetical protein